MKSVAPQSWFFKCALAAALCLSFYAVVSLAGPKAPRLQTSRDGAAILLDRYMNGAVPNVLVAGSSLSARLNEAYFDTPDLKVLGLAGGSAITALEIALTRDSLPKIVLIEMNILDRGEDSELVQKFTRSSTPAWPRPIQSAIAFYERWRHPPPDREQERSAATAMLEGPPSGFDNRIYIERAVQALNTAPSPSLINGNLATLKRLVEKIRARGSRVYLYTLPLAPPVQDARAPKAAALAAHAQFPEPQNWIPLNGSLPDLRWADGVHLDERSAVMIARQIDGFLKGIIEGS
jgi:hypothetical protein